MLGSQWSKDELERFYGAYRKHGKDWRKIAGAIRDRTSDMVESLYNMYKAYLSLPEGTATAAGLIAMMTDHYNILDGSNSDQESNDSPKASTRPQKRGRAEFQSVFKTSDSDYTDLLQPQPASLSYGWSKKKRFGDESSALDALHTLADLSVNILPPSPVVKSGSAKMYIRRDPRQRRAVRGRHSTDTGATGAANAPEDSGAVHRPSRLAAKRLASEDLPRGTLHIDEEAVLPGTSTDDETEEEIKEDEPSEHPHGKRNAPRQHESSSSQQAPIQDPVMLQMRKPSAPAHITPTNYMGAGMTPRQHGSRSSHQAPIQHRFMLRMC
ncbi:protein ALWAYS EARLY 3-like [Miscanthus floridulus]|uniref:protein ALWAYS EARLY 3-like n=1 Tax=Miscanthus floridulus TaxID=154761 RepID=UPI003459D41B